MADKKGRSVLRKQSVSGPFTSRDGGDHDQSHGSIDKPSIGLTHIQPTL